MRRYSPKRTHTLTYKLFRLIFSFYTPLTFNSFSWSASFVPICRKRNGSGISFLSASDVPIALLSISILPKGKNAPTALPCAGEYAEDRDRREGAATKEDEGEDGREAEREMEEERGRGEERGREEEREREERRRACNIPNDEKTSKKIQDFSGVKIRDIQGCDPGFW